MKNILLAVLMLAFFSPSAQNFDQYEPLTCSGKIPEEFILASSKKYKADLKRIEKKDLKKRDEKNQKQFALESNFVLDDLLQSGLVLFGDPVSEYLNEVAAKVLETDKDFKKKVRVYALRSATVNAFAADRGTVFVSLGLLAQLENEAQLAYILSHELSHVQEGHSLDLFLEAKDIVKGASQRSVLEESTFDEKLLAKNRYNKELEIEADKKGIARFWLTNYSPASIPTVFDVLQYAHLPFDEVPFERSFFETDFYQFPEAYWIKEVKPINTEPDKEDDPESTHPNIEKRRELAQEMIEKVTKREGKDFLVSEERFLQVRQMARFELPMIYLHNERSPDAIYAAHLLLQKFPGNAYLEKCVAKALYINAKFENDEDYQRAKIYAKTEGESQRVRFLFDTISPKEATILALRYTWLQHLKHPEDKELTTLADDLFGELAAYSSNLSDFVDTRAEVPAPPVISEEEPKEKPIIKEVKSEKKEKSKYDKIKEQKAEKAKTEPLTQGWKGAFIGLKNDENFVKAFNAGQERHKKWQSRVSYMDSDKGRSERRKEIERTRKKGKRLGISKVVIINPFYLKLDARKANAVQYVQSEEGQNRLRGIIEEVTPKSGLKTNILDIADLKDGQTDRFNEIRLLNEWFAEQVDYENLNITYGTNQGKINAIAEKYGTDFFLWTGVVSLREKKNSAMNTLGIMFSLFLPILTPVAIYKATKPEYDMLYYAVLYNVKDGTYQTVKYEYFDQRDSDTVLKAHYYDALLQIKTKRKK
jgi:beta-barrel assembly-enhancing protease